MDMNNRILVTGLSGLIGTALRAELEDGYELSALNRRPVDGIKTTQADLAEFEGIEGAFANQELVIHLGAVIHDGVGWDALLQTNVVGTRNVFEAAANHGVKRVIFASSGATVSGWEREEPYASLVSGRYDDLPDEIELIDEDMATRPANIYASTKVWGESIARHYADNRGIEVICLRIGYASEEDRPLNARQFSVWNSRRDVVQAIRLAMDHDLRGNFDIFFILSDNRYGYRDLTKAKTILGYAPEDSAESFR